MTGTPLDQRLRDDAARLRRQPAPDLSARIQAELGPQAMDAPGSGPRALRLLRSPVLAAAAGLALVASIWIFGQRERAPEIAAGPSDVVELSRDLLNPPLLASLTAGGAVEDPFLVEARNLWADTSRAAESVARGLRTPLRLRADGQD